jgi:uncharacterized integral membrane protein
VQEEPEQSPAPPADDEDVVVEQREGFGRQWQPRLYLRLAILGVLLAYGIAFVLENNKHVHVHFVIGTAHVSLIWLILLSVALGLLLGVLVSQLYRRSRRRH